MGKLPFEVIDRKVLVRSESETSSKYGIFPNKRAIQDLIDYGVVNIDKPSGPTSHQISSYVKHILGLRKAGHSGTLDPKVTGVLPVTLGRSTKVVQTLLKAGKEYVCLMHIHHEVEEFELYRVLNSFVGSIRQLPPVKSAVKRQWRFRNVYYIDVLDIKDKDVLFKVGCEAGTYIRKLCTDIGAALGTGAHMVELRRTKAGPFDESTLWTLQDLEDAKHYLDQGDETFIRKIIRPVEVAVSHLPRVWVTDTTVDSLCHGASLAVPGICKVDSVIRPGEFVAVLSLKEELIAFGTAKLDSQQMLGKSGLAVIPEKVIMEPGTYPRFSRRQ